MNARDVFDFAWILAILVTMYVVIPLAALGGAVYVVCLALRLGGVL